MSSTTKSTETIRVTADARGCPICGSAEFAPVCEVHGFRYVSCAGCSSVRQFPYPSAADISSFYANYYGKKSTERGYLSADAFAGFQNDKQMTFSDLGLAGDAFAHRSVLDVGCGTGQFVQMMSGRAKSVEGIDVSTECINIARNNALNCSLKDFLSVTSTYDVITMWHVVEHLLEPRSYMEQANHALNPGGWLLVETPVIGAISRAFGASWRYFLPVEHLNLFTQQSLFRTCVDAGFDVRRWVRFGSGNTAGTVPPANKRAMDRIAKQHGFGDTIAVWLVKREKQE